MVLGGTACARTGIWFERIITTIECMVARSGDGADSVALVCTVIACEPCTEITRVTGGACAPTGTSGGGTITTRDRVGSGVATAVLAVTCIVCAFSSVGMAHAGTECGPIGICGAKTTTTTVSMEGRSGVGAGSGGLESTGIGCERSIATTRAIGDVCALTGTCGSATITTSQHAGSGAVTGVFTVICIACESSGDGLVLDG